MLHSKVPRPFVLASCVLCFLVTYTTFYLYRRGPPVLPTTNGQANVIAGSSSPLGSLDGQDAVQAPKDNVVIQTVATNPAAATATDANIPTGASTTAVPGFQGANEDVPTISEPQSQGSDQWPQFEGAVQTPESWSNAASGSSGTQQQQQQVLVPDADECPGDLQFLVRASIELGLTESVEYTRRVIRPTFSDKVDRDEVANVTEPLLQGAVEVDLWNCWDAEIPELPPIKLEVPKPYAQQTYEHLIFGVATDYARLNDSIPSFAHSLADSQAQLVAVVTDATQRLPGEMEMLTSAFAMAGINATLVKPIDDSFTTSQNHFTVLTNMLEVSTAATQWYGLLDDDTFFPNLKPLSDGLATVDHTKDAYVGALSEDFSHVRLFGFMAFGGAGAYLSAPLARKLGDQAFKCLVEATSHEGDIIIRDCVYTNSKAKLTLLPGLYQQDTKGDVSGFFEAGFRPLCLHHWKSWYDAPVEQMSLAAHYCGDCFLQRWRFGTDTVFSNGFSIVEYPDGLDMVDLNYVEGTWEQASREFDYSIGPLRPPFPPQMKHSYRLMDAEMTGDGGLRQLYIREGNPEAGELDKVVELIWEKH
ncbi:glycosyltransferase family 31 protein [Xylariomycetidae sp. FL0641]|nr:glycosyltransferase family 31 protein [Xylariomycetidae sp. FL0641]